MMKYKMNMTIGGLAMLGALAYYYLKDADGDAKWVNEEVN